MSTSWIKKKIGRSRYIRNKYISLQKIFQFLIILEVHELRLPPLGKGYSPLNTFFDIFQLFYRSGGVLEFITYFQYFESELLQLVLGRSKKNGKSWQTDGKTDRRHATGYIIRKDNFSNRRWSRLSKNYWLFSEFYFDFKRVDFM